MKKVIIALVAAVVVLISGIVGAKFLLDPGNSPGGGSAGQDNTGVFVAADQEQQTPAATPEEESVQSTEPSSAVEPVVPGKDDPIKLLDIGIASFHYDSTKLVFDEIPSDEEDGTPMVSFMLSDVEETLPRVDAMPLKVSDSGEGDTNFYNMTEESWQNLAAASVLQYLSPRGQEKAQISFSDTVVKKEDGPAMKMFTNITITIPSDVSTQTGDSSMTGAIRLVSNGENAVITMAMCKQGTSVPSAMREAYMSLQVQP